jgi:hypothetical protein
MGKNQPKCVKLQTRGRNLRSGVIWQVALRRRNKNWNKRDIGLYMFFLMRVNYV